MSVAMSVNILAAVSAAFCAGCNLAFVCYAFLRAPKRIADESGGGEQLAELCERVTDLARSSGGAWQLAQTNRHLPDDPEQGPGSGELGWCIYLEDAAEEGPFAWLPARPAAASIVDMHNELLDGLEELLVLAAQHAAESGSSIVIGRGR